MKKLVLMMSAVWISVFFLPYQAMATPKIEVDQPVFNFQSVPEGEYISHEFMLKNTGDTLLTITDVRPP